MSDDTLNEIVTEVLTSEPADTQPLANTPERGSRYWVPATWAAPGTGGGHPKLSGGEQLDRRTGNVVPRSYNRPDQRYSQADATMQANRTARAASEYPAAVVLLGANETWEVRSASGNNYDLPLDLSTCDCPDRLRLDQSGKPTVQCKHQQMVLLALADPLLPLGPDWSAEKVAQDAGVDVISVRKACQTGLITASKKHNVWMIPHDQGIELVGIYTHTHPTIDSVSPPSIAAGSATFTATITGAQFNQFSRAVWNGTVNLSSTFVSNTVLQCIIPGSYIAFPGTFDLRVENAYLGGSTSTPVTFDVT